MLAEVDVLAVAQALGVLRTEYVLHSRPHSLGNVRWAGGAGPAQVLLGALDVQWVDLVRLVHQGLTDNRQAEGVRNRLHRGRRLSRVPHCRGDGDPHTQHGEDIQRHAA